MERLPRQAHRLAVRTRRAGEGIRIEIEDTGTGIPGNLLERIFNPFFTTKPPGAGTGLGLSISLGIVREHEGRIWAENVPAGGARFVMELPLVATRGSGEFPMASAATHLGDRLRILVVDDEMSVRVALQRYLAARGHDVEATASGQDALTRLAAAMYDAVIVDMRMPDLSGEELYRELATKDADHAARVIFTTGDLVSDAMRKFVDSTGRPCVVKPFEFAAFDQALPARRKA
jgi:CheY-like chemotaxis protein